MKRDKIPWSEMESYPVPANDICPALRNACRFKTISSFPHLLPIRSLCPWLKSSQECPAHNLHIKEHTQLCRHMMKLPARDSAFSQGGSMICGVNFFWPPQPFSGLLWGEAAGIHPFKNWGTFNGGKITGSVWIKTAFQPLTFLFPWLLLIAREPVQLVEGENVKIFLFMFCWCSAILMISKLLLCDQRGFCGELGNGTAPRAKLSPSFSLCVLGNLFLTKPAYVSCSYKREIILNC